MEYQKIVNLLDNSPNLSSKFKAKSSTEINDESQKELSYNFHKEL